VSHYALTREAPDGENSVAFQAIQSEKNVLKPLLPEKLAKGYDHLLYARWRNPDGTDGFLHRLLHRWCTVR
jgi:hypothetical protein